MAQIRAGTSGRLTVGTIMGAVPCVLAPIANEMHAKHPDLAIEIVEDTSANMLVMLDDGRVDLVIGRASVSDQPSKYHYQPLTDEPMSVVVGHDHPQMNARKVSLADLAALRWVTYPTYMSMSALLQRELDLAGLTMPANPISTASSLVTVTLLQQSTELVSILPASVARLFETHGMLRIPTVPMKSKSQTYASSRARAGRCRRLCASSCRCCATAAVRTEHAHVTHAVQRVATTKKRGNGSSTVPSGSSA